MICYFTPDIGIQALRLYLFRDIREYGVVVYYEILFSRVKSKYIGHKCSSTVDLAYCYLIESTYI